MFICKLCYWQLVCYWANGTFCVGCFYFSGTRAMTTVVSDHRQREGFLSPKQSLPAKSEREIYARPEVFNYTWSFGITWTFKYFLKISSYGYIYDGIARHKKVICGMIDTLPNNRSTGHRKCRISIYVSKLYIDALVTLDSLLSKHFVASAHIWGISTLVITPFR